MSETKMDGDSWVFDSLVNFLHGNIWKIPVLGFIEEKSVVFDPDSYNNMSDEKEDEFRKVHEEYKALVDYMLASFMEDLQVTPEQVEEACQLREKQKVAPENESHITKVALEQLQAAEDFMVFRRIMTRKNIDLQLQSLELLVAKYGVLSPALRSEGASDSLTDNGEEDFLQVVIRYCDENDVFENTSSVNVHLSSTIKKTLQKSLSQTNSTSIPTNQPFQTVDDSKKLKKNVTKLEHEIRSKSSSCRSISPTAQSQQSLANPSLSSAPENSNVVIFNTVAAEMASSQLIQQEMADIESIEKGKLHQTKPDVPTKGTKKSVKFDETTVADIATVAPEEHRLLTSVRKALDVESAEEPTSLEKGNSSEGSEEEIQKRREYLEAQRDKLVAFKKRERERQLTSYEVGESQKNHRPKSAKAAQIALRSPPTVSSGSTNEKSLAARRALAARLRQELLEN